MSELTWVENTSYSRYEALLLKREQYAREADSIQIAYTQAFGELQADIFRERIECIRLRKLIGRCQAAINRGMHINFSSIQQELVFEMSLYQEELNEMLKSNREARRAKSVSPADTERVKKIYRRLAKRLHPDLNPKTEETPELMDLWNRIAAAYRGLNVREMAELEVLANRAISELGLGTETVDIPDLEQKIQAVENEINEILTTKPYIYHKILDEPEQIELHRENLQIKLEHTEDVRKFLEGVLNNLLAEGGIPLT